MFAILFLNKKFLPDFVYIMNTINVHFKLQRKYDVKKYLLQLLPAIEKALKHAPRCV